MGEWVKYLILFTLLSCSEPKMNDAIFEVGDIVKFEVGGSYSLGCSRIGVIKEIYVRKTGYYRQNAHYSYLIVPDDSDKIGCEINWIINEEWMEKL